MARAESAANMGVGVDGIDGVTVNGDELDAINAFFTREADAAAAAADNNGTSRRSSTRATPNPVDIPFATCRTGKTPTHRGNKKVASHELRASRCLGVPYGQKVEFQKPAASGGRSSRSMNQAAQQEIDLRRVCSYCGKRTDYYCHGCSRYLCFSAPKEGEGARKKHPKYFKSKIPIMDSNGNFIQNGDGSFQCEEVVTRWTCHAAAHQEGLRTYLTKRRNELISTAKGIPPSAEGGGGERSGEGGDESERVAIQSASAAVPVSIKRRRTR